RSKIVAHAPLYVFDRRAECGDIAFRQRGQSLHQDKAAEVARVAVRERRKHAEDLALRRPMHAVAMGIQHQKNPPRVRERHPADDRCGRPRGSAPAVDHETAALEYTDADPRTRAASQPNRIARDVEGQAMQAAQRSRYRERKLRPGAEPGMGRDDFVDPHIVGASKTERAPHRLDVTPDPFPFGAGHPHLRRRANGYARLRAVDGQADAAEAPAESAVEIQKAEMQPCRSSHGDIGRQWSRTQPFSPEAFSQTGG